MAAALDVAVLTDWIGRTAEAIAAQQSHLSDLDAAIGDGDHGANMARGFAAVAARLGTPTDPASLFKAVGMTLIGTVGGASGPLYGSFFLEMGKAAGAELSLDAGAWARVLAAGVAGIAARGKAQPGDKTMLDALIPSVAALRGASLAAALAASAEAARHGAAATTPLIARKGRASYLGERSAGHPDPGATSAALILACLADAGA